MPHSTVLSEPAPHETPPLADAHAHLFGSLDIDFLKTVAERNGVLAIYAAFLAVRSRYQEYVIASDVQTPFAREAIALIWEQFSNIKKILLTLVDVEEAVVDVARKSTADHIELRSTPKPLQKNSEDKTQSTIEDYVSAFLAGLRKANNSVPRIRGNLSGQNKKVKGLLSIDRTTSSLDEAKCIIDRVAVEKKVTSLHYWLPPMSG